MESLPCPGLPRAPSPALYTHRLSRQPPGPNLAIVSLEEEEDSVRLALPAGPLLRPARPITTHLPALHPHQGAQEGPVHQYHPGKQGPRSESLCAFPAQADTDLPRLVSWSHSLRPLPPPPWPLLPYPQYTHPVSLLPRQPWESIKTSVTLGERQVSTVRAQPL